MTARWQHAKVPVDRPERRCPPRCRPRAVGSRNALSEYEDNDADVRREQTTNGHRHVAVVGLRDPEGRVLMVRTRRLPGRWQPIGGGMEPADASPVEALIRELKEEASIEYAESDFRLVTEAPYDFGDGRVHFFEARFDPSRQPPPRFDPHEILEYRWLSVSDAQHLLVFPATKRFLDAIDGDARGG